MNRSTRHISVAAALILVTVGAAAAEAESGVLSALRAGTEVLCEPLLPYFCENVHVRCAGQTTTATFPFRLRAALGSNSVLMSAQDKEDQSAYEGAATVWAEDATSLLLTPRSAGGYVKVLPDGKYVLRHYIQGRGVMSLGQCK